LHIRPKAIKLLEENIAISPLTQVLAMIFLDLTPKVKATKAKIKWDCINLKSFCTAMGTINKMKINLLNGGKYLQIIYLIRG